MRFITDEIIRIAKVIKFSPDGSTERMKEEATYMLFLDYLHFCEGNSYNQY